MQKKKLQIKQQKVDRYLTLNTILFVYLVIEERNKYAVEICKRIRDKLDGSDPDPLIQSSISEQVQKLKSSDEISI